MKFGRLLLVMLLAISLFTGCSRKIGIGEGTKNDSLKIVTSFYPMYLSAINITDGIENVEVINMTKPQTGCLHDYQLTPADLVTLEDADAFIINGAGMESFLDKVISARKNLPIIEASRGIAAIKDDSGEENPHMWLSIANYIKQIENITAQLSQIDIKNAAKYQSNGAAYIDKLKTLGNTMHASIDTIKDRNIIPFHEAFPYFAKEFNLNIAAVIEREPGTAPTPAELTETIDVIKKSGAKAIFTEPQYSSKAAETIKAETGISLYTLDPIVTGQADKKAKDDYITKMMSNLESLKEALK